MIAHKYGEFFFNYQFLVKFDYLYSVKGHDRSSRIRLRSAACACPDECEK